MTKKYKKGEKLELDFAKFMINELGYDFIENNLHVKGDVTARSFEVDVHGMYEYNPYGYLRNISYLLIVCAVVSLLGIFPAFNSFLNEIVSFFTPKYAAYSGIIFGGLGGVLYYFSSIKKEHHTWVECKDLVKDVNREQVNKLVNSSGYVEDFYNKVQGSELSEEQNTLWKANSLIFVSGKSYDQDALSVADKHGISCYVRTKTGFEQI